MRYGIYGDIHGNLPAFQAVLAALESAGAERHLCLGDVVGYGARPAECVRLVREVAPVIVAGNHDWGAAGRLSLRYFNSVARTAIEWTRTVLSQEDLEWLGSLELVRTVGGVTLAHGTMHDPQIFDYLITSYDAFLSFRRLLTSLGFVGHSHVPVTFFDGNPVTVSKEARIELHGRRAIANVGSVGQPRDEDSRASFGIYDEESGTLEIRRIEYDIESAAAQIRQAGLPDILAERLHIGR